MANFVFVCSDICQSYGTKIDLAQSLWAKYTFVLSLVPLNQSTTAFSKMSDFGSPSLHAAKNLHLQLVLPERVSLR